MVEIEVLRPDVSPEESSPVDLASRGEAPDDAHLTIIENGKPNARPLLEHVAEELRERLPVAEVETVSKPSAAKPIDADEARMLAARSHLVITGLGD